MKDMTEKKLATISELVRKGLGEREKIGAPGIHLLVDGIISNFRESPETILEVMEGAPDHTKSVLSGAYVSLTKDFSILSDDILYPGLGAKLENVPEILLDQPEWFKMVRFPGHSKEIIEHLREEQIRQNERVKRGAQGRLYTIEAGEELAEYKFHFEDPVFLERELRPLYDAGDFCGLVAAAGYATELHEEKKINVNDYLVYEGLVAGIGSSVLFMLTQEIMYIKEAEFGGLGAELTVNGKAYEFEGNQMHYSIIDGEALQRCVFDGDSFFGARFYENSGQHSIARGNSLRDIIVEDYALIGVIKESESALIGVDDRRSMMQKMFHPL